MIVGFIYQVNTKDEVIKFLHLINDFDEKSQALEVKQSWKGNKAYMVWMMSTMTFGIAAVSFGTALRFELEDQYDFGY